MAASVIDDFHCFSWPLQWRHWCRFRLHFAATLAEAWRPLCQAVRQNPVGALAAIIKQPRDPHLKH